MLRNVVPGDNATVSSIPENITLTATQVSNGQGEVDDLSSGQPTFWVQNGNGAGVDAYDEYTWLLPNLPSDSYWKISATGSAVFHSDTDNQNCTAEATSDRYYTISSGNVGHVPGNVICVNGNTGNDQNSGADWSRAKATIQGAFAAVDLYNGINEIWVAATAGGYDCGSNGIEMPANVQIYGGFGGDETQRRQRNWNDNVTTLYSNGGGAVVSSYCDGSYFTTVDGFTIGDLNSPQPLAPDGFHLYCSALTISHNKINTEQYGIYSEGSYATISHNEITAPVSCSALVSYDSSNLLDNNLIIGGMVCCCGTDASALINNTIVGAYDGVCASSNTFIGNCIIAFCLDRGIVGPAVLSHNCVYGEGQRYQANYDGAVPDSSSISQNPLFVNRNSDYHLRINSPCIDAGSDAAVGDINTDLDNGPRVLEDQGTGHEITDIVDIGAYEFGSTTKPGTPAVTDDGAETTDHASLHAVWSDNGSGISGYNYLIGTSPGCLDSNGCLDPNDPDQGVIVYDWHSTTNTEVTVPLSLQEGVTYYFFVRAYAGDGNLSDRGVSDGIKCVAGGNPIAPIRLSPCPGEYDEWQHVRVSISCGTPGATIQYSIDNSDLRPYDGHPVLIVPSIGYAVHLHVVADKEGYSRTLDAFYTWRSHCQDPDVFNYNCFVDMQCRAPSVEYLTVSDVEVDPTQTQKSITLSWHSLGEEFYIERRINGGDLFGDVTGKLSFSYKDQFDLAFDQPEQPRAYEYRVSTKAGYDSSKDDNYWPVKSEGELMPWDHPYYRYHWADEGEPSTVTVVFKQVLPSENASVDSRLDMRAADDTPLDHHFKPSVFHGGMFVGARSLDAGSTGGRDGSGIGRAYIKFHIEQMPQGQRLWSAGLYTYYTGSRDTSDTAVGCQPVNSNWTADTLKWSDTLNIHLNPAAFVEQQSLADPSGSLPEHWCKWDHMFGPIAGSMYDGSGAVATAFAATNEPANPFNIRASEAESVGWAYFAKEEYNADLAPRLIYAYGNAPCSVVSIQLDRSLVQGGDLVHGTVYLNAPAPAEGYTAFLQVFDDVNGGTPPTYPSASSPAVEINYGMPYVVVAPGKMTANFEMPTAVGWQSPLMIVEQLPYSYSKVLASLKFTQ